MAAPPRALSPIAITRCRGSFGSNGTGPLYPGNGRILVTQRFTCLNEVSAIGWIVQAVEPEECLLFSVALLTAMSGVWREYRCQSHNLLQIRFPSRQRFEKSRLVLVNALLFRNESVPEWSLSKTTVSE